MPEALVLGVGWSASASVVLSVMADGVAAELPLPPEGVFGFRVRDPRKHCLGFSRVHGPSASMHLPCPEASLAERGYQCGPCFGRDEFRFMHDFHRGGVAPAGLRDYLAQPHWLYIATFAHGASKVGTASDLRKWIRLAEQGAVAAQYVAHADDGRIVRILEDSVSSGLELPQQIRSAAKAAALVAADGPSLGAVEAANAEVAHRVRNHLAGVGVAGFRVVDEPWTLPEAARKLLAVRPREAYPLPLLEGAHGLPLNGVLGSFVLSSLEGHDFIADLAQLKGRIIEAGDFRSELPSLQDSLF